MGLSSTGLPGAPAGTLGVLGFLVASYRVEMLYSCFRVSRFGPLGCRAPRGTRPGKDAGGSSAPTRSRVRKETLAVRKKDLSRQGSKKSSQSLKKNFAGRVRKKTRDESGRPEFFSNPKWG